MRIQQPATAGKAEERSEAVRETDSARERQAQVSLELGALLSHCSSVETPALQAYIAYHLAALCLSTPLLALSSLGLPLPLLRELQRNLERRLLALRGFGSTRCAACRDEFLAVGGGRGDQLAAEGAEEFADAVSEWSASAPLVREG